MLTSTPPERYRVRVRKRRRKRRRLRRWLILIALALLLALAAAVWTALPAWRAIQDARTQLRTIEAASGTLRQAASGAALVDLDQHDRRLLDDLRTVQGTWAFWRGPALFLSGVVPHIHRQLEQVDPLLEYGVTLASAGDLLSGPAASLVGAGQNAGTLLNRLVAARPALRQAAALLDRAGHARRRLTPENLPAEVRDGVRGLDPILVQAPPVLRALTVVPDALGETGSRDYLVIPQNSKDLRATGGFIGTVGILHVDRGRATLTDLQDSYDVDQNKGYRPNVDPPLPMGIHGFFAWYFRDVNWSADFPTTARLLEVFYRLGTHRRVDGVLAFDSLLLPHLIDLTGPVPVPGYPETLTPRNAFERIDYYANVLKLAHGKAFAAAAYRATFERLLALPQGSGSRALSTAAAAVRSHDLLLYANDPAVEDTVRAMGADGAINQTRGDYLYLVDQNVSINKVNGLVRESIAYQATIQPDRSILATTTLTYTNDADTHNLPWQYGDPYYSDFVRVFVPAGSTLLGPTGLDETWPTYAVHNKTQFSGYFDLPSHWTRTFTFRYRIPANADPGGRYTLLVQKQTGATALPLDIRVSAAPGVRLGGNVGHLMTALGTDLAVEASLNGGTPHLQHIPLGPAEPPVVPGGHPEVWVTVPTRLVGLY